MLLNGRAAKPAHTVRAGDRLLLRYSSKSVEVEVLEGSVAFRAPGAREVVLTGGRGTALGAVLGALGSELASAPGLEGTRVVAPATHDTGSAVAQAFYGVPGIDVVVLFPHDEVSERQRRQMTTLGQNITALSVTGKFDDCQAMVKRAFADATRLDVPPDLPFVPEGAEPALRLVTRGAEQAASEEEHEVLPVEG